MMSRRFLLVLLFLLPLATLAQVRFAKYPVAGTGANLYFPADPGTFELSLAEDGSEIYTGSVVTSDSLEWGAILVKLKQPVAESNESFLLKAYLDHLKEAFDVVAEAGYGEGHTSESNPGAIGIIDYWQDGDGNVMEIKGWINTQYICVLFVSGKKEVEKNFSTTRLFLNGVRFP